MNRLVFLWYLAMKQKMKMKRTQADEPNTAWGHIGLFFFSPFSVLFEFIRPYTLALHDEMYIQVRSGNFSFFFLKKN